MDAPMPAGLGSNSVPDCEYSTGTGSIYSTNPNQQNNVNPNPSFPSTNPLPSNVSGGTVGGPGNNLQNIPSYITSDGKELIEKPQELKHKGNFHLLMKELQLIKTSGFKSGPKSFDVLVGRLSCYDPLSAFKSALLAGQKDAFMEMDLGKMYFVKDFRLISIGGGDNDVKEFTIYVKNDQGKLEKIGRYVYPREENTFQIYEINRFSRVVKLECNSAWGNTNGSNILIKKIAVNVADIE